MRTIAIFWTFALLSSIGYGKEISDEEIVLVERECVTLESQFHPPVKMELVVRSKELTQAISALHPARVTVSEEGVYIAMSKRKDRESGFFCLDERFSREWATSTGWRLLGTQLYAYSRRLPHDEI